MRYKESPTEPKYKDRRKSQTKQGQRELKNNTRNKTKRKKKTKNRNRFQENKTKPEKIPQFVHTCQAKNLSSVQPHLQIVT